MAVGLWEWPGFGLRHCLQLRAGGLCSESEESSATDGERRRGSDEKSEREGSLVPPEQVRSAWGSKLVLLSLWGVAGIAVQGVE